MEEIKGEILEDSDPVDEEEPNLEEEIREFLSQDVNLEGMERMDSDRRDKIKYISSFQRCLQAFRKYVVDKRSEKIEECDGLCAQAKTEIEQQIEKLKNPDLKLNKIELKDIERRTDRLWDDLRDENLYKEFTDDRVYCQFFMNEDDIMNKFKAMLGKKNKDIEKLKQCSFQLNKKLAMILTNIKQSSKSDAKENALFEIRQLMGERERRVPGIFGNNTNQASVQSMLDVPILRPKARPSRKRRTLIGPKLMRERKEKEKVQEIIECESNNENILICEQIQKNLNQPQNSGITSRFDSLCMQSQRDERSSMNAPQSRKSEKELNRERENKINANYLNGTLDICNEELDEQVSNKESSSQTQYYHHTDSKYSCSSSIRTKHTPGTLMTHFSKPPDISSSKQRNISMKSEARETTLHLALRLRDKSSQELNEECKEESKSDIYMDDKSQNFDDNLSYPLEGSSVMYDLSDNDHLMFIQNCKRKLPNLQNIGFCINGEIPQCLLESLEKCFPDEVQYCKFYFPASSRYLKFDIPEQIRRISCKALKAFEFSRFQIIQFDLEWFIKECTIANEIIFSHCLFCIPDGLNLFGLCKNSCKNKLVFDRCHANFDESSSDSPNLVTFEMILQSIEIPDVFRNRIVCSQTSQ
ncbi:unnamed protein product [Moneuplotes crassus]|uniref:Uncharacterized protein n=1 Tax=Euplotes crassus TaxID=5936 RepID=A0AAD1U1Z9_EUPCR|nr:unnamed protein product [Moneuplotes crassus]